MLRYLCLGFIFIVGCKSAVGPQKAVETQPVSVMAKKVEIRNVEGPLEFAGQVEPVKGDLYKVVITDPNYAEFVSRLRGGLKKVVVEVPLAETLVFVGQNKLTKDNEVYFTAKREAIKFMPARVKFFSKPMKLQILPLSSLVSPNGKETYVYQIDSGRAKRVEVKTWKWESANVILLNNVEHSAPVIFRGAHKVTNGTDVEAM